MRASLCRRRTNDRRGYVMLVALVLLALLAVLGSTTLNIAGVDQRIAIQNRKHMLVVNTAVAGTEHARDVLRWSSPTVSMASGFISNVDGEAMFGGLNYAQKQGAYSVDATFLRCGSPPPGYSAEVGSTSFRSDYWELMSTARMLDTTYANMNESQARAAMLVRKVSRGSCASY